MWRLKKKGLGVKKRGALRELTSAAKSSCFILSAKSLCERLS